jgi:hypothetical protein
MMGQKYGDRAAGFASPRQSRYSQTGNEAKASGSETAIVTGIASAYP